MNEILSLHKQDSQCSQKIKIIVIWLASFGVYVAALGTPHHSLADPSAAPPEKGDTSVT